MIGILFATMVLMLFLQVVDYITTVKAMDKGFVEGGFFSKWLFSKIGIVWGTFAQAVFTLILAALFGTINPEYGISFASAVSIVLGVGLYKNFKLLRKN